MLAGAAVRVLATCLAVLLCGRAYAVDARTVSAINIGETARVDIISPFPLVILDKEKTAELKLKQAQRIPSVFRWEVGAVGRVGAELRERFDEERGRFLASLAITYKTLPLNARAAGGNPFRQFVTAYQTTNRETFVTLPLARIWATNGNDVQVLGRMEERLATAAARYIRPDHLGPESKSGWTVRLVAADKNQLIGLEEAEQSRIDLRRNELVPLSKARSDLSKEFQTDERPLARFCATVLRPNCFPEEEVTRDWRQAKTKDIVSVRRYAAGELIVRAGETVTEVSAAAMDEVRLRLLAMDSQRGQKNWLTPGLLIGMVGLLIASGLLAWSVRRRRSATHDLQVVTRQGVAADPLLREQIAATVTRLLGYRFIQRLLADREHSMKAQAIASIESQGLQRSVEQIQQRVQQRYAEYETRIQELERELASAEEQNQELIRARIVLARQEKEQFEAANPEATRWN